MRFLFILVLFFLTPPKSLAQDGTAVWGLENGTAVQTSQQRDAKPNWNGTTSVMWNEHPLRETLGRFAKMNNIGLMLDRRVDPGTPLSLDLKQVSVRDVFEQAAAQVGCAGGIGSLGFCELETVAYLGPLDAAELLQLLVALRSEQLAKLPKAKRDALFSPRPFRTELLDTPVETLQRLAEEIGFDGTAFDRLPHDVWPEIDFPNEPPLTVFSLILIGFDCTLAVSNDATKLAAIPIPRELIVTREYVAGRSNAAPFKGQMGQVALQLTEAELLAIAPDAGITPISQGVSIKAPLAQAAKIEMLIVKRTTTINAGQRQTNTVAAGGALERLKNERLTVPPFSGSLDITLKTLADRMQLELVIDEESFAAKNVRLDTRISTSFEQATVTEVFEKCLAPVGALFRFEGETVIIYME